MIQSPLSCPLCSSHISAPFHQDANRSYIKCSVCKLVFAHPRYLLSREVEFSRYEYHQNDLEDPGYRAFLDKLFSPMIQRIKPLSTGLDFGSGPGPLLKLMFQEAGHKMSIYDTFYAPDPSVFEKQYDFITISETVEHLHRPLDELDRLWACLIPGGYLGVMTGILHDSINFSDWHYIRDDTHVVFFTPGSFEWLAQHWESSLELLGDRVVIFRKIPNIVNSK